MKRKTRVFMIAAGIITLVGVLVCFVGLAVGKTRGEQIFPDNTDKGDCYTYYFGDKKIGKVSIDAVKAEINIIGTAERSRIEVINFNENLCSFTNSNAMVSFKENPDISSTFRFWESGFTFKGIRYLLHSGGSEDGGIINIYLAPNDVKIKSFELETLSGKINISNMNSLSDYNLTVGTGSISLKNVFTDSSIMIYADDTASSAVTLDQVNAGSLNISAQKIDLKATGITTHDCYVSARTGSVGLQYFPPEKELFTVEVESIGKLIIDGCEDYLDSYKYVPDEDETAKKTEDGAELASLKITGNDLSVDLDTPLKNTAGGDKTGD